MYSQKIIQSLKPDWYLQLSKSEKLKAQKELQEQRAEMWANKPNKLDNGYVIVAKDTVKTITKSKSYKVQGYFATRD